MTDDFVAPAPTSYDDFGRAFFRTAVTSERIVSALGALAGEPIDFGPLGVGPGRIAKVSATGSVGTPHVERVEDDQVRFLVGLPVDLALRVDLQMDVHRFDARLTVPLELAARPAHPCVVFIEVTPPRADQVDLELKAGGFRASMLQRLAGVDVELKRFVAKYVAPSSTSPASGPRGPSTSARRSLAPGADRNVTGITTSGVASGNQAVYRLVED